MDSPKISITIAHAEHRPERRETLERMQQQLWEVSRVDCTPGKPHEWSLAQWKRGLEGEPTHCCYLNDDLILCDDFVEVLGNVVKARPTHVINLYNAHPAAHFAKSKGAHWLTSPEGLIGNAYVIPADVMREFLTWRETCVVPEAVTALSEDQLINLYVMFRRALVWHTVPALVDHDTTVPSLFGNTQIRRPEVRPKPGMAAIDWSTDGVHMGRQFVGNHWGLIQFLKPEHRDVERAYLLCRDVAPAA